MHLTSKEGNDLSSLLSAQTQEMVLGKQLKEAKDHVCISVLILTQFTSLPNEMIQILIEYLPQYELYRSSIDKSSRGNLKNYRELCKSGEKALLELNDQKGQSLLVKFSNWCNKTLPSASTKDNSYKPKRVF
jgi:hypothetical protein